MPKYTILIGEKFVVEASNEDEAMYKLESNSPDVEFIEVDSWVIKND
jgi:hypothetical protein